jgi:Ion transport protein
MVRLAFGNDKQIFHKFIVTDSVMDLLYLIDMMIKFFVAIEIRGEYISDRKVIAKDYLRYNSTSHIISSGFFWIDLISVLPYQLFAPPGVQMLKMLRVIYVLPILDLWTQIPKYVKPTFTNLIISSSTNLEEA